MIIIKIIFSITLLYLISVSSLTIKKKHTIIVNQILKIPMTSYPASGFKWYLTNAQQIKQEGILLPINLNNDGSSNDYQQKLIV